MKNYITAVCYTLLLFTATAYAQNTQQEAIAKKFVTHFINKQVDSCWVAFDKEANAQVDHTSFVRLFGLMRQQFPDTLGNNKPQLYLSGINLINGKKMPYYSYKYEDDVIKPASISYDVVFVDSTATLIAGFRPKALEGANQKAASSKGKETVISTRETIKVEGKEYVTRGVNIIHFENNGGIVALQIESSLPDQNNFTKEIAEKEALKFAKWLYHSPYYTQAQQKAKEIGITLEPNIGVSFIGYSGAGFNCMLPESVCQ